MFKLIKDLSEGEILALANPFDKVLYLGNQVRELKKFGWYSPAELDRKWRIRGKQLDNLTSVDVCYTTPGGKICGKLYKFREGV